MKRNLIAVALMACAGVQLAQAQSSSSSTTTTTTEASTTTTTVDGTTVDGTTEATTTEDSEEVLSALIDARAAALESFTLGTDEPVSVTGTALTKVTSGEGLSVALSLCVDSITGTGDAVLVDAGHTESGDFVHRLTLRVDDAGAVTVQLDTNKGKDQLIVSSGSFKVSADKCFDHAVSLGNGRLCLANKEASAAAFQTNCEETAVTADVLLGDSETFFVLGGEHDLTPEGSSTSTTTGPTTTAASTTTGPTTTAGSTSTTTAGSTTTGPTTTAGSTTTGPTTSEVSTTTGPTTTAGSTTSAGSTSTVSTTSAASTSTVSTTSAASTSTGSTTSAASTSTGSTSAASTSTGSTSAASTSTSTSSAASTSTSTTSTSTDAPAGGRRLQGLQVTGEVKNAALFATALSEAQLAVVLDAAAYEEPTTPAPGNVNDDGEDNRDSGAVAKGLACAALLAAAMVM